MYFFFVLDSNGYLLPMQESNSTVAEERPVPEGACEPVSQNEAMSYSNYICYYFL